MGKAMGSFLPAELWVVCWSGYQVLAGTKQANSAKKSPGLESTFLTAVFFLGYTALLLLAQGWLSAVTALVPEPYLDEVFHIPQAQKYCGGKWLEWDDKITTPPGLYVATILHNKYFTLLGCSTWALRAVNNVAIVQIAILASWCRALLEQRSRGRGDGGAAPAVVSLYAWHTSLNVALFPALFFFSAMYYTDLFSTLAVLLCYRDHLLRIGGSSPPGFLDGLVTIVLGVVALAMRQTNVFWVVVYMGGLEVVDAVKRLKPQTVETPRFTTLYEMVAFYGWRYSLGDIHDPPVGFAWPDDWVLSLLSIGIAAVCNLPRMLRQIWPHITALALFAAFVVWNGGVVLGDKSNHVATLHLAQMLYIWPLFAFFSAPLFLSRLISIAGAVRSVLFGSPTAKKPTKEPISPAKSQPPPPKKSALLQYTELLFTKKAYYPAYLLISLAAAFLVVRYNTIIHPFTLADNRHYMFYVFRYTILRPGAAARYVLVPVYAVCAHTCWQILAGSGDDDDDAAYDRTPFASSRMAELTQRARGKQQAQAPAQPGEGKKPSSPPAPPEEEEAHLLDPLDAPSCTPARGPATSTALLWLLATTLSLVTAPLVEPRYFILPWVFWRLLVPAWPAPVPVPPAGAEAAHGKGKDGKALSSSTSSSSSSAVSRLLAAGRKVDARVILETVWFLAINAGTMYMFLFRPFYWRAADGSLLDGGRQQRFMW